MARRQIGEQFDHGLRDAGAEPHDVFGQLFAVEQRHDLRIAGKALQLEPVADRRAEQQVFADAEIAVVPLRIEGFDEPGVIRR
jgi:hypothetical protein